MCILCRALNKSKLIPIAFLMICILDYYFLLHTLLKILDIALGLSLSRGIRSELCRGIRSELCPFTPFSNIFDIFSVYLPPAYISSTPLQRKIVIC